MVLVISCKGSFSCRRFGFCAIWVERHSVKGHGEKVSEALREHILVFREI